MQGIKNKINIPNIPPVKFSTTWILFWKAQLNAIIIANIIIDAAAVDSIF